MAIVETSFPRGGVVRSKAKEAEIVSVALFNVFNSFHIIQYGNLN